MVMHGSRQFCQSGYNSTWTVFLADDRKEDPNSTKSGLINSVFAGGPIMAQH